MPWCEECAKYWTPSAMTVEGTCPSCGRSLEAQKPVTKPTGHQPTGQQPTGQQPTGQPITAKNIDLHKLAAGTHGDEADAKAPWHFKLLMVMLALYLGWRVVDLFL